MAGASGPRDGSSRAPASISRSRSLQRLRANPKTRLLAVVILTSSIEEQDLVSGYRRGANSYIRKPVDFKEFVEELRQLGLYWPLLNHAPPVP
jgi:two-component system, response regulator